MKPKQRAHFDEQMRAAAEFRRARRAAEAWTALERAHVLSQAHAWPHLRVHLAMLCFALSRRRWREAWGQLPRILLAAPGSWLGRAPRGNTGGANVGIFTPMPIPEDLSRMLSEE
jgi:hypothetical protein